MNRDEAKAHVAAHDARLRALEVEVARLASEHPTPVLLAMLRVLVEMVCQVQGPNFAALHKTRFYEGVMLMLREKGIACLSG